MNICWLSEVNLLQKSSVSWSASLDATCLAEQTCPKLFRPAELRRVCLSLRQSLSKSERVQCVVRNMQWRSSYGLKWVIPSVSYFEKKKLKISQNLKKFQQMWSQTKEYDTFYTKNIWKNLKKGIDSNQKASARVEACESSQSNNSRKTNN